MFDSSSMDNDSPGDRLVVMWALHHMIAMAAFVQMQHICLWAQALEECTQGGVCKDQEERSVFLGKTTTSNLFFLLFVF